MENWAWWFAANYSEEVIVFGYLFWAVVLQIRWELQRGW